MRKPLVLLALMLPLVPAETAAAKLPPFSFEASPASPRVGEPISLTMRCFEDVEHARPWPRCFGDGGTMAWVHPLDDEGALDRRDWIPVQGHATPAAATRGTVVLGEPGPYLIAPLWSSWAGGEHGTGFPDAIRLDVVGNPSPSFAAGVLGPTAALAVPALLVALMMARRAGAKRRRAATPDPSRESAGLGGGGKSP